MVEGCEPRRIRLAVFFDSRRTLKPDEANYGAAGQGNNGPLEYGTGFPHKERPDTCVHTIPLAPPLPLPLPFPCENSLLERVERRAPESGWPWLIRICLAGTLTKV